MGADALIEFEDAAGASWVATWTGSDETYFAPVFCDSLDYMLGDARERKLIPLSELYDHSVANGEAEVASKWFAVGEGIRTLDVLIGSFEWFTPGEASFSPGERVAGAPAEEVYASLKNMRGALEAGRGRGATMFRLVVYD